MSPYSLMNPYSMKRIVLRTSVTALATGCLLSLAGQAPQQTPAQAGKTTAVDAERSAVDVRQGTVVYAAGNDLVVKMTDDTVKHFTVPPDAKFRVDGKDVTTADLKPGTQLTQTITTTTRDQTVTDVRNVDVRIRSVMPPYVTVSTPDGTVKTVKVPEGTKITIDGQQKTVFDLKAGDNLKGTIVTTTPETRISSTNVVTGKAPEPTTSVKNTPQLVGILLFEVEPEEQK